MMKHSLIVTEPDWSALRHHFDEYRDERMGFGYCGVNSMTDELQYLLKSTDLPRDDEYRFQRIGGVSLKAECTVPRLARARGQAAFVDAHSHPFTAQPFPSETDEVGAIRQFNVMRDLAPGTALIRLVFGATDSVWAEITEPESICWTPLDEIVVLGPDRRLIIYPLNARRRLVEDHRPHDKRTRAVLGAANTLQVRHLKVAVVGAGGVGSAVLAQLRGYVDDLAVIDQDIVELHNAPRLYHYTHGDVGQPKAAIHRRELLRAFPDSRVHALQASFPGDEAMELFKRADFIFCCPDHNAVRYAAARAAARFMKPMIEVGCGGKRVDGRVVALGYHVRLQVPGVACLACNGLDLRELEDPSSSEMKRRSGYIDDGDLVAGELIPLTTRAAADAVDLFFRYVSGYAAPVPRHLYFDALRLQTIDATSAYGPNPDCTLCGDGEDAVRAAGDRLGPEQQILRSP